MTVNRFRRRIRHNHIEQESSSIILGIDALSIVGECVSPPAPPTAPAVQRFREPEVQDLDGTVLAHLDVRRFEIAMNDPLLVRTRLI